MSKLFVVVGSLNREAPYFQGARGVGLSVFSFDPDRGTAELICEDGGVDNPTFLSVDPISRCIYANSEVFGWHEGTVSAYRFDPGSRRLYYINKQPTLGSITAHNSLDSDGRHLLVANYGMGDAGPDRGMVVYRLRDDGGLSPPVATLAHHGKGPNAERQERAHPHCVLPSPDGHFAMVADLGLDAILSYRYGPEGRLSEQPAAISRLPSGSGPRHIAFHPNGAVVVAICELDSTLSSLRFDPHTGGLTLLDTVAAVPETALSGNHCSDLQIHPNGRFVYGANRGHDSIVIMSIDAESGRLSGLGHHPCGGTTPRNLAIDPSGRFLIVANQNSDLLAVLAIDAETGRLSAIGNDIPIGTPMCVKFMPA